MTTSFEWVPECSPTINPSVVIIPEVKPKLKPVLKECLMLKPQPPEMNLLLLSVRNEGVPGGAATPWETADFSFSGQPELVFRAPFYPSGFNHNRTALHPFICPIILHSIFDCKKRLQTPSVHNTDRK
jgi:hypothetical protein